MKQLLSHERRSEIAREAAIRRWSKPPHCKICPKPRAAKGLCHTHYARLRRHGDPNISKPKGFPKVTICQKCGKARDMSLKYAFCRPCYNAYCRDYVRKRCLDPKWREQHLRKMREWGDQHRKAYYKKHRTRMRKQSLEAYYRRKIKARYAGLNQTQGELKP